MSTPTVTPQPDQSQAPAAAPGQMDPAFLKAILQQPQTQQGSTAGLTGLGPSAQRQPQQRSGFKASGIAAIVMGISNKLQQRKQREQQTVFDTFTGSVKGVQEAQGQAEQGSQMIQEAVKKLQENPNDEEARKMFQQGAMLTKQAKQALQLNQTNLDDMFNGPKGEKHAKMLAKGFGIDDKNAGTPERQAAISSVKKQLGVGDKAANLISRMPQRQQLSPEAQQRAQVQQAGILPKPATGGQILSAQSKHVDQVLKAESQSDKVGLETDKMVEKLPSLGLKPIRGKDGSVERNPDGTLKTRNLTLDELKDNPVLAEKYQAEQSKVNLQTAQAKATAVRANVQVMKEKRLREQQRPSDPSAIAAWEKQLLDPKSGVTLAQVKAGDRGLIVSDLARKGLQLAKPLTGDEIKRADLATNAIQNLKAMQDILERRPDLFGPGGWGKTKFEYALSGGDKDAIDFLTHKTLANLPLIGIHGVRGKWSLEDMEKLDGNLYLNAGSMKSVLDDSLASAGEFADSGGRQSSNPKDSNAPPPGAKIIDLSKE